MFAPQSAYATPQGINIMTTTQLAHKHHRTLCAIAALTIFAALIIAARSLAIEINPLGIPEHTARTIAHITVYAIITLLIGYALRGRYLAAVLIAATLGAIEELYQLLIPNRYTTLEDWLLDLTGASAAATLAITITIALKFLRRPNQQHNPADHPADQ